MMHRTTISLSESVYASVMQLAAQRGRPMARTIEDLLRQALDQRPRHTPPKLAHHNDGPRPGIDIADRDQLFDLLDG